jgi:hypothetical protein
MRRAVFLATILTVSLGTSAWAQSPAATPGPDASGTSPTSPATTPAPAATPAPAPMAAPAPAVPPPAAVVTPAPAVAAPAAPPAAPAPVVVAPAAPAPAAPTVAAAPPASKLLGLQAWSAVVGNTITGREEGKLLTEFYAPDGSIKSMHGNEISTGQWALVGETVCVRYSGNPKTECYKVEVSGDAATFLDRSGSGTRYRILKGNPRNL